MPLRSLAVLLPPCPSSGPSPPPPRRHTHAVQADPRYARGGMGSAVRQLVKSEGAIGLYRGILPIVASTGVQKSALFSANAGARRACEQVGLRVRARLGLGRHFRVLECLDPNPNPNPRASRLGLGLGSTHSRVLKCRDPTPTPTPNPNPRCPHPTQSGIPALTDPIPCTSLSPSLLVGGVAAGTARAVVETPFELAKVR